ncbi:hypothetical protein SDC9_187065 [bioreactor metagenome]|uniref:Uncharacterized protein n=1 Tax=bioreactor metagenome TaxID=1076179 RepID=A0A645HKM5_9ZZZZ
MPQRLPAGQRVTTAGAVDRSVIRGCNVQDVFIRRKRDRDVLGLVHRQLAGGGCGPRTGIAAPARKGIFGLRRRGERDEDTIAV